MRFMKIALPLFACTALAAFAANAAQAQWTIGTSGNAPLGTTGHETLQVNKKSGTTLTITGNILATPITLTPANVLCASTATCTIDGTSFGTDHSTETLEFTGVAVTPTSCSLTTVPPTLTTQQLTGEVIMDPSNGMGPVFKKLSPASGTTIATFKLKGELCPLDGAEGVLKGVVAGKMINSSGGSIATGVLQEPQLLEFGSANQTTGGALLKLGTETAQLTGTVVNTLPTLPEGSRAFGAD